MAIKQKDFVKAAIVASFAAQAPEGTTAFTREQQIGFAVEKVKLGLMSGDCSHSTGFTDETKALAYAKGVVKNYLRRDTDINGTGVAYKPANPRGPRVTDEKLKELTATLVSTELHKESLPNAEESIAMLQLMIAEREAEVAAEKAAKSGKPVMSNEDTLAKLIELGVIAAPVGSTDIETTEA